MSDKNIDFIKFPFFSGIRYPFDVFLSNIKSFFKLSFVFSAISCVVFYFLSFALCWGRDICVQNVYMYFAVALFYIFIIAAFIDLWQKTAFGKESAGNIFKEFSLKRTLKVYCFLLYVTILYVAIFGGIYYLKNRVVTASFEKELSIFIIVSLFVCLSIFGVLCMSVFVPYYKQNEKYLASKICWSAVDNIYIIFGWFILFLFLLYFIITILNSVILFYVPQAISDFVLIMFFYFIISLWISMLNYQYKYISGENE